MNKKGIFFVLMIFVFVLGACQPIAPAVEVEEASAGSDEPAIDLDETILEVIGSEETKTYSMNDILGMQVTEGRGGTKSSTGRISLPTDYTGITILDLLESVGGFDESMAVQVEAKDGYYITFSYAQLIGGDFITYDPGTGDESGYDQDLNVLVAYKREGNWVDPEGDGPLRLMIIGDEGNPVTDGHWAVKWVSKITVKPLVDEWVLSLEGKINEEMDRVTFETGAAPGCHETRWTDENGNEWLGIPLYYLVGRVDDDNKHESGAFEDDLAKNNAYTIEVIAGDGYSKEFDSFRVMRNDNIILAYMINGDSLEESDFPLKLVGSDLEGSESVSQVAKIILHFVEE